MADRPVRRFGIDRSQVPAARAGESARRLAQLVDIDVAPYVKQVEAAGDLAFVEAIVYRRDDVPVEVARGYDDIQRLDRGDRRPARSRRPASSRRRSSARSAR